jgi:galactokinase
MARQVLEPSKFESADARAFVAEVETHPLFAAGVEVVIARAPGRLDLMGGIADYSGSLVLQWPLQEATLVAAQRTDDGLLQATSLGDGASVVRSCVLRVEELFPGGAPIDYDAARKRFADAPGQAWAAYVFGVLLVLVREKGILPPSGLRLLIRSAVPEGKGVSSSAALEVATLQAIAAALRLPLDPRELALLAQTAENRVVGAACGVMDQMTASCGEAAHLLALLCQPAELRGVVTLPDDLEIWGIDSGVRHAVSGSDYTSVRTAAFMGARILGRDGYLANVTPSELAGSLPETLGGAAFLSTYGGITDSVTRVEPARSYSVRACASHPVHEHFRVRAFAELLMAPPTERRSALLGELMYQSHASYSACGLGAERTDLLVALARGAGAARGFFGAKITGGGSGGTVAILGRRGAPVADIARDYEARTGHRPHVFSGSSPGSAAFGTIRLGASR